MLTTKKKKFANALKKGCTSKEAAIHAGYSEKTARVKGCQLAKDPDVKRYLERVTKSVASEAQKVTPEVTATEPPAARVGLMSNGIPDPIQAMALILTSNIDSDPKLALDAAFKLAQFTLRKPGEMGKKESQKEKARAVSSKFSAMAPPPNTKH